MATESHGGVKCSDLILLLCKPQLKVVHFTLSALLRLLCLQLVCGLKFIGASPTLACIVEQFHCAYVRTYVCLYVHHITYALTLQIRACTLACAFKITLLQPRALSELLKAMASRQQSRNR